MDLCYHALHHTYHWIQTSSIQDWNLRRVRLFGEGWDGGTFENSLNIYAAKEIFIPSTAQVQPKENFKLFQKFCKGYANIKDLPEVQRLNDDVYHFRKVLKANGLKISDLREYQRTFGEDVSDFLWRAFVLAMIVT